MRWLLIIIGHFLNSCTCVVLSLKWCTQINDGYIWLVLLLLLRLITALFHDCWLLDFHLGVTLDRFHVDVSSLIALSVLKWKDRLATNWSIRGRWCLLYGLSPATSIGIVKTRWIVVSLSRSQARTWLRLLMITWWAWILQGSRAFVNNALSAWSLRCFISLQSQVLLTSLIWKFLVVLFILVLPENLRGDVWNCLLVV